MYYRVIGALVLLIGIIVLIKYIMRTGETKTSCSIRNEVSPPDDKRNEDEVAEISGIEIDVKEDK
ncbi:MAG: hypothetical protein PHV82_05390 [Victivallaceae bacterium]|nr:hypothetical protein [Victivallaceae bacterium]